MVFSKGEQILRISRGGEGKDKTLKNRKTHSYTQGEGKTLKDYILNPDVVQTFIWS